MWGRHLYPIITTRGHPSIPRTAQCPFGARLPHLPLVPDRYPIVTSGSRRRQDSPSLRHFRLVTVTHQRAFKASSRPLPDRYLPRLLPAILPLQCPFRMRPAPIAIFPADRCFRRLPWPAAWCWPLDQCPFSAPLMPLSERSTFHDPWCLPAQ
jgi:hypothetical protein